MKYYYAPNHYDGMGFDDAIKFESERDIMAADNTNGPYDKWELTWLVEEMAEDFFDNHDGWDQAQSWSMTALSFGVWDSKKNFVGIYDVTLEYLPSFHAYRSVHNK